MRRFLANNRLLIAAWVIVLAALSGGLGYLFLTPPPPPRAADTVTLAVPAPPPPPETATLPEADSALPPEETAETSETGDEAEAPADTADEGSERPEPTQTETAQAETGQAETTAAEAPSPPPSTPPSTPPSPAQSTEEPAPEGAEAPPADDGQTIALPQPKPEPPAQEQTAAVTPGDPLPEAETAPDDAAAPVADEQAVNVPLIPPAPEDLPYWERYRQPFNNADERPRVAVVLSGLGLSDSATQAAIDNLPAAITLSFSPYARGLERWIALARARGHEVMLDLPMEPTSFPNEDPGPQALLTSLSAEDNLDRLDWVLSRGSAYVGVAGSMGSRFTASLQQMEPVLRELKSRGLVFLDNRTTDRSVVPDIAREIGLHSAFNNRAIDERQASRVAIDARLAQIERIALSEGFAVAMAQPYPVTLDRLAEWTTELTARGIVIAPISALVDRQEGR